MNVCSIWEATTGSQCLIQREIGNGGTANSGGSVIDLSQYGPQSQSQHGQTEDLLRKSSEIPSLFVCLNQNLTL